MIKIFIHGKTGKMGKEILSLIQNEKKYKAVDLVKKADVIIDFSSATGIHSAMSLAQKYQKPLVSGSTGLQAKTFAELKKTSKKVAVLWSSNMSIGIAVVGEMLRAFSKIKNYDFYIEETHHIHKKDQPSGTAKTLENKLTKAIQKKVKQNISLRGGGVFGQHRVISLGQEETILIQHDALSRTVFARGALLATEWLLNQRPGFYQMDDIFLKD